jgi:SM-20-related protein
MSSPTTNTRIWLTLLLQGGHRESLSLEASSPLFDKLRDTLSGTAVQPWLFQIPIKEGAGLLTVHSTQVIGVITEPPMPLTLQARASAAADPIRRAPLNIQAPGTGFAEGLSSSRAARVENVLSPEQHKSLVQFATRNRQMFTNSTTSTGASDYRESLVCYSFPPFDDLLRQRVLSLAPKVAAQLGLELPDGDLEIQLTAHNDGHYYRVHNDSSGEGFMHRVISFVYYFHRTPKGFSGGELRLFDRDVQDGLLRPAATYKDIAPLDNSLVFFDSRDMHEVMPVQCPSQVFADGRFTINGWLCTKKPLAGTAATPDKASS